MADCASDPPAFEVTYGVAYTGEYAQGGVLTLYEGNWYLVGAQDVNVDPCITEVRWESEGPAEHWPWQYADDWDGKCTGPGCWDKWEFESGTTEGSVWIVGTDEDRTFEVAASPVTIRVLDLPPDIAWAGVSDIPPWIEEYTLGPPPATLVVGEEYRGRILSELAFDSLVLTPDGEIPPGFRVYQVGDRTWDVGYTAEPDDVGRWTFDIVATDEEGSTDTLPVAFEVVRACGCAAPIGSATWTFPWLILAPALAGRRRR